MIRQAERTRSLVPSATLEIAAKANRLKKQGKDIISMSAGEPDFPPPQSAVDAASGSLTAGHTKYTAVDGIESLKQAVVNKFKTENRLTYSSNEILISCGAKHSIYNFFMSVINPGDEVIIPAPYWVSYPEMVMLCGGVPIFIPTSLETGFKISAEQLNRAITPKTKLFILNSPSNPTGQTYTSGELAALASVLVRNEHVLLCSDDIYEHILWLDEGFHNILNAEAALRDRTVIINGVSKCFSMTGLRIGYAAGPSDIIATMKNIQSQSTSNPSSTAQYAAEGALAASDRDYIDNLKSTFKDRHDFLFDALIAIPGMEVIRSTGTFYSLVRVSNFFNTKIRNDTEFCSHLLDSVGVAVVPGSAFGAPGHIRLSYAIGLDEIGRAVDLIRKSIAG